jgi:hypothetical protein
LSVTRTRQDHTYSTDSRSRRVADRYPHVIIAITQMATVNVDNAKPGCGSRQGHADSARYCGPCSRSIAPAVIFKVITPMGNTWTKSWSSVITLFNLNTNRRADCSAQHDDDIASRVVLHVPNISFFTAVNGARRENMHKVSIFGNSEFTHCFSPFLIGSPVR